MNPIFPRKLLIFAHDASLYGASLSLLTILEHLAKDNSFEIFVVLPYGGKIEDRLVALNIKYTLVPFPRCVAGKTISIKRKILDILGYFRWEYKMMPRLKALAMQFNPDLVYTNTSAVTIGNKLARRINVPHVWHIREFFETNQYLHYLPFRAFVRRRINESDTLIFASEILRKLWVDSEMNKYRVIYNGIVSEQLINSMSDLPVQTYKFGLLGYLVPEKGQDIAIRSFLILLKHYPDCELHFYGDISDKTYFQELQKLIAESGCIGKIVFHSFIIDNRLIYKDLQVLISCSSFEGVGRTIVEAMSYGIPVIANINRGNLEIIEDGVTGLLYYRTPEGLAEKMISLASNPGLYNTISKNALAKARENFSIEKYVNEVTRVLKNS